MCGIITKNASQYFTEAARQITILRKSGAGGGGGGEGEGGRRAEWMRRRK